MLDMSNYCSHPASASARGVRIFLASNQAWHQDQDHVWLKNYQNVNLDLIWFFKLHNFTVKLREHLNSETRSVNNRRIVLPVIFVELLFKKEFN